jgi:hypothetical protein
LKRNSYEQVRGKSILPSPEGESPATRAIHEVTSP